MGGHLWLKWVHTTCNLPKSQFFHKLDGTVDTSKYSFDQCNVTSITASQDVHTRLMLQVYLGSNTSQFSAISRQKFTATKPEVGFRDKGFVLPEVESLRVQTLWLPKNALPSREEPDISLSIVNTKHAFLYSRFTRVLLELSALNIRSNNWGEPERAPHQRGLWEHVHRPTQRRQDIKNQTSELVKESLLVVLS